jgi:hypothetical protein
MLRIPLVVKALGYKPEGRGFETLSGEILKNILNSSGRTKPQGSNQPVTKMSSGNIKKIMFLGE